MILVPFFLLTTVLGLTLAGLTFAFFAYFRKLSPHSMADSELPFITVIVPARNEEKKIRRCLESLAHQNYPRYEVIAVDDRSQDRTGVIIEELAQKYPHLKYVRGRETPSGWIGKCNALVHAVKYASGEWFLFTDADTWHTKESLRYSMSYALSENAELISFMPVQELGSFWEKVVMPVLLGSFLCGDPLNTINEHTNDRAYAYGQYILVRRKVYEEVGGHESVHDQILDDISFARVVKQKGHHIMAADGRLLYKVRMYTDLTTLWQGWTKNLFALIECKILFLCLVILLINMGVLVPFLQSAFVAWLWLSGNISSETPLITACAIVEMACLLMWYKRTTEHYVGVDLRHFFLLPLGSLTVSLLYLHSAFLVLTHNKVSWKGRKYTVNISKSIEPDKLFLPGRNSLPDGAAQDSPMDSSLDKVQALVAHNDTHI